ncbi:phage major capsid protein, HK97 family [Desulfitobacterium hafniense DCB-2]|uniref:Phage major capsid protein, HK97 family n=1 Tax=Desulfitobacterium hafniense (strain DSM 10664 / DCB-2) TaxID=272564 RepID=B8FNY7_DESHD|nr:phage major capsid protein [Desulfitobacterium hafniense]ACL19512.1 phage major capsid protein, HK97 family [Desulfitobacterium hafniense DCB-2]
MKKIDELRQELSTKKEEVRGLLENDKVNEAEAKMPEVRTLETKIKLQSELDEAEEREVQNKLENRKDDSKMEKRTVDQDMEYRAIGKFLLGSEMTAEERASVNIGNSGAILPQGFVNQVQVLTDGFPSLKKYCHVIPTTTTSGKMPISSGSTSKKLAKLATDNEMVKEMITTKPVEYATEDYGKIIPVENSVLEDTTVDFFNSLIAPDFAECAVNSENEEIINIVEANSVEFEATDYKGIVKCLNTKVKPSLLKNTIILTNQSGYDYLDNLTDAKGRPLLNDSLAVEGGKTFKGREIVVLDDTELPAATDKKVFYIVNLYALIKFFDRKGYEIAVSKEAGFTYNQTFVRVIERFDTVKGDSRAAFKIEF